MVKLGHIELFVADPMRSKAFYTDVLGFELVAQQPRTVWLKCGQVELLLRPANSKPPNAPAYDQSAMAIVLYTDDLPATMAALESRGLTFRGSDGPPCCPTFTDPDGHWFQLVDPKQQQ